MYSLEKVPEKGNIRTHNKRYNLTSSRNGNPRAMSEMVRDLCRVFFDALINFRMVAEYSAAELYKANYREFLSSALTGGCQTNIHTPCWHVFTPRSAKWNDEQPPPPFHPKDAKDPEKPRRQKKKMNARYSITAAGCAVPVNEETYEYGQLDTAFIEKFPPIHSIRDEHGNPLDASQHNLDLDSTRTNTLLATEQTNNHLKEFLERVERRELAIFGQFMTETVQNLSQANLTITQQQLSEAVLEEKQEEELDENARLLIGEFKHFDPNITAQSIVTEPREGMMVVELVNDSHHTRTLWTAIIRRI